MSGDVERTEVPPPAPRRRAIIYLALDHLADLIEIPPGLSPVGMFLEFQRNALGMVVQGDHLAEQHEGSHLPELEGGSWRRLTMTDDDGRRWVRFEWAPRADGEPG